MTAVSEQIVAYFDLTGTATDLFVLDDDTLGELDGAGLLAGDIATDITPDSFAFNVSRGRSFELDEIQAGRADIGIRNYDALYFPQVYNVTIVGAVLFTDGDDELLTDSDDELLTDESTGFGAADNNIKPGKRIQIVSEGITIFDGSAGDWTFSYDASTGQVDAAVTAGDALAKLARRFFLEWTSTDGDLEGERLVAILDRSEVGFPAATRDIDTGLSTLQDDLVTYGSNVLNYCQLVAKSGLGRLFASRQNILTYRDRQSLINPTVKVIFTDDVATNPTGIRFRNLSLSVLDSLLYTDVTVDADGLTAQHVFDADARIEAGGIQTLSLTTLLQDEEQCEDLANYLLGIYKTPQLRVDQLVCRMDGLDVEDRVKVLGLDIGDVVSVVWTPTGADTAMDRNCVVEGIAHSASTDGPHDVTLTLSLLQSYAAFVLDDDVLGVLDESVLSF